MRMWNTDKLNLNQISSYGHMILGNLANFIDFKFLYVCAQNTKNFVLKIWEMVKKIKVDVDRQLSVWGMKKSSHELATVLKYHMPLSDTNVEISSFNCYFMNCKSND